MEDRADVNSFLSVVLFWRIFRSSTSTCLWFLSMLSVSFQPLWSSATSAQEVAPSCTWTGGNRCVCVILTPPRFRNIIVMEQPRPSPVSPSTTASCLSVVLLCRAELTSVLSISLSVSSWPTLRNVRSTRRWWSSRTKVKLRVHVVWFVRPAGLELLFSTTRKTIDELPTSNSVHSKTLLPRRQSAITLIKRSSVEIELWIVFHVYSLKRLTLVILAMNHQESSLHHDQFNQPGRNHQSRGAQTNTCHFIMNKDNLSWHFFPQVNFKY